MRTLLVIPAYNEEEAILSVIDEVVSAGYDYVVVNDGSTDRTDEVLTSHGINHITLPFNLGIGGAVQTGHRYAYLNGYDADIQVDGDGQHDISYVPDLLAELENGADIAVGSRFLKPSEGFQSTGLRRAGIKWLERIIRMVSGVTVKDSTSGFRACNRKTIGLFCRYYPIDYPEPESIVYAHNHGLTIREVPVNMRERQGGTSSINLLKGAYYMIKVSLAILIEGLLPDKGR